MMEEMVYYATKIGTFLPGSEPQFMKPGLSLHIHGSTRVGVDSKDSVVNRYGRVHGFNNLYLGGNGLIPRAIACNPTLTNVAYALETSRSIAKELGAPIPSPAPAVAAGNGAGNGNGSASVRWPINA
jgi:pyranose oxidase